MILTPSAINIDRRRFLESLVIGGATLPHLLSNKTSAELIDTKAWAPPPLQSSPNILIIMVDQMRAPVWLNEQQTSLLRQCLPNILGRIRNKSFVFQQHYTAATVCTASRGTLLTGLYAPQTLCFTDQSQYSGRPPLFPQFPTFAHAVPKLNPAYSNHMWWFGKWHVSACNTTTPLRNYGFHTHTYPGGAAANPGPDGYANEGTGGGSFESKYYARDADIANDFTAWITSEAPPPPASWCATVSLINPHDISRAPAWLRSTPEFPPEDVPPLNVYFSPPPFPPPSGPPAIYSTPPSPWNYENLQKVTNKPAAQYAFWNKLNEDFDPVVDWVQFLNWYYWLQFYVDQQVGVVLDALANSPYAENTIVIFTSDHGEYGGSHGLHDKGAAAYDEAIHVPLYVRFPGQSGTVAMSQMTSSVDFFGLICDLATSGLGSWKIQNPDLASRQSIWNFLYTNSSETRLAPTLGIPYVFHTCDQINIAPGVSKYHLVAMRTKYNVANTAQPGAKLGVYYEWGNCTVVPDSTPPDFEFYDYNPATSSNLSERGNDYFSPDQLSVATMNQYLNELGVWGVQATGLIGSELTVPLIGTGTDGKPMSQAHDAAAQNYTKYLWGTGCS